MLLQHLNRLFPLPQQILTHAFVLLHNVPVSLQVLRSFQHLPNLLFKRNYPVLVNELLLLSPLERLYLLGPLVHHQLELRELGFMLALQLLQLVLVLLQHVFFLLSD